MPEASWKTLSFAFIYFILSFIFFVFLSFFISYSIPTKSIAFLVLWTDLRTCLSSSFLWFSLYGPLDGKVHYSSGSLFYYNYHNCYSNLLSVFHTNVCWWFLTGVWETASVRQSSRTLLSILADLYNSVIWMVSACTLISKSSSLFINPLLIVPSAPITIGITISFMLHYFFSPISRSRYYLFAFF